MLKIKTENIYMSRLFFKFMNTLIYMNLRLKMENLMYLSFFYWKKKHKIIPLFIFFEALLRIRPLMGFYVYIIKKKNKKKIKIKPYYMSFKGRWLKAIYWLTRAIKMEQDRQKFYLNVLDELYGVVMLGKSKALKQKIKFYQTILKFKSSKNYKW